MVSIGTPFDRPEAKRACRLLAEAGYSCIVIVEEYPEKTLTVQALNPCSMPRTVASLADVRELLA